MIYGFIKTAAGLFGHPGKGYQRVNDTQELSLMLQAVLTLCPNKPSVFIKFRPALPSGLAAGPHASGSKLHTYHFMCISNTVGIVIDGLKPTYAPEKDRALHGEC